MFIVSSVCEECFHFIGMIWYAFLSEEAATVSRNEDVVLDAYAAEVLILFNFVEA